jgi:hypothetical protein
VVIAADSLQLYSRISRPVDSYRIADGTIIFRWAIGRLREMELPQHRFQRQGAAIPQFNTRYEFLRYGMNF